MRSDIALGVVTFLMAILGGIVSAHAPTKTWQKWVYGLTFVALGAVGLFFVIKQSNETAVASTKLEGSLRSLGDSLKETARLQGVNTQLQGKLLTQSDTIASMSKETISQLTGKGTFLYFTVAPNLGSGDPPSFPLSVWVNGKYPMREVTTSIQSNSVFVISPNLVQPTLPLSKTLLPGLYSVDYRLGLGTHIISTWCAAGGPINEVIKLTLVNGQLDQQVEVWGWGKRLYKQGKDDLGFAEPKKPKTPKQPS
jgi:hypothetical protein